MAGTTFQLSSDDDLPFEEEVIRNPYSLKSWLAYIEYKKNASGQVRFTLYERALRQLPGSYKLWFAYLQERVAYVKDRCITHKSYRRVNNAFERALVFMHKMPRIWKEYQKFLIHQQKRTETRRVFDRSLQSLPITQHELIWAPYLDWVKSINVPDTAIRVYRRYMKLDASGVEDFIEYLVGVERWEEAAKLLAESVNDPMFVSKKAKSKHQLWLDMCDITCKHPEDVKSIKVEAVIRAGLKFFKNEVGRLWTSLADYYIRLANFEQARNIYEEAIASVMTVRDFSQVFDAYAQFEESIISAKMAMEEEEEEEEDGGAGDADAHDVELDMLLARFERLMDRRPALQNAVVLRQKPHDVAEWLKRAEIFAGDDQKVIQTYTEATTKVDPWKAFGQPSDLWVAFAKFFEENEKLSDADRLKHARGVFEQGTQAPFKHIHDLATIWCEYAEMELRHENFDRARDVMNRATSTPPRASGRKDGKWSKDEPAQDRLYKSVKMWSFAVDLEESLGTLESTRAVYDRMFDLKVITPQIAINYAHFLEGHNYFEDSFKVYERAVSMFKFPHSLPIWSTYLTKFVGHYKGTKLERARDLFEQALEECPAKESAPLYTQYAQLEEEYGLHRHAMAVYDRAVKAVPPSEKYDIFTVYVKRCTEIFGITKTREIYESVIDVLPDKHARLALMKWASLERKLGEVDRARALYAHCSQLCDPKTQPQFWSTWHDFEVAHGNEDTFREMLRVKRTVQAKFNTSVNITAAMLADAAANSAKEAADDMEMLEAAAEANKAEKAGSSGPQFTTAQQRTTGSAVAFATSGTTEQARELKGGLSQPAPVATSAEQDDNEIDLDDLSDDEGDNGGEDDDLALETKAVPDAVFGDAKRVAESAADGDDGARKKQRT